jgi:hypothetical protein
VGATCGTHVYKVLMGKPEGKRPLGRPRRRWKDGIRIDLRENGWGSIDWIQLAQDRDRWRALVNTMMNLRVLAPRSSLVYGLNSEIFRRIATHASHATFPM